ncbi:MAG: hypothetical protein FWE74_08165 [Oscillospiraceae bacterium]|nr:hypothetical protein [Oscillospiraceae bacterium]
MQEDFNTLVNNDEQEENESNESTGEQVNPTSDCGIVSIKNAEHSIHILTIIGQMIIIDRVKYSTRFPCRSPF